MCSSLTAAVSTFLLFFVGFIFVTAASQSDETYHGLATITAAKCEEFSYNGRLATKALLWVDFYFQSQRYKSSLPEIRRYDTPDCPYAIGDTIPVTATFHGSSLTFISTEQPYNLVKNCELDDALRLMLMGGLIASLFFLLGQKTFWSDVLERPKEVAKSN